MMQLQSQSSQSIYVKIEFQQLFSRNVSAKGRNLTDILIVQPAVCQPFAEVFVLQMNSEDFPCRSMDAKKEGTRL